MEETKKFLRYVIPGLIFVVELIFILGVLLFFTDIDSFKFYGEKVFDLGGGLGAAVTFFLLSGGLGAVFAGFYHYLISIPLFDRFHVDYSPLLEHSDNKIILKLWNGKETAPNQLKKLGQWRALTSFWNIRLDKSELFQKSQRRCETLHDIAHGLGAQLAGSCLIAILVALFDWHHPEFFFGWGHVILVILVGMHWIAFRSVIHSLQTILSNIYIEEFRGLNDPVVIYVNPKDLKSACLKSLCNGKR